MPCRDGQSRAKARKLRSIDLAPDPAGSSPLMTEAIPGQRPALRAQLGSELVLLRKHGLVDPRDRLHLYRALLYVGRRAGFPGSDRDVVEGVLIRACEQMGAVYGPAALVILGVAAHARGLTVKRRHELAYDEFCKAERSLVVAGQEHRPPAFSTFETRTEKRIFVSLIDQLLILGKVSRL